MAPWLHDIIPYPHQGLGFERVLWALALLLGLALAVSERRSDRRLSQNPLLWLTVAGLLGGGGIALFRALSGDLTLGDRGLPVPSYGVAMALGFAVPLMLARRSLRRHPGPISHDESLDLAFVVILSGLAGARGLGLIQDIARSGPACLDGDGAACAAIAQVWTGGLVFYGGVIGALIAGVIWCAKKDTSFWKTADFVIPYMALGHAIGRLGCFLAGCCHGAACESAFFLGVPGPPHLEPLVVHPVQLYEAVAEFALFLLLRRGDRRWPTGRVVGTWLVLYGFTRFGLEVFRGDVARGFIAEWSHPGVAAFLRLPLETPILLSTSQLVAILMICLGLLGVWRRGGDGAPERSDA